MTDIDLELLNVRITKEPEIHHEEEIWEEQKIDIDGINPHELISHLIELTENEITSEEVIPTIIKLTKYYSEYQFEENVDIPDLINSFASTIHKLFYNRSYNTQIYVVKLLNCLIEYRYSSANNLVNQINELLFYTNLVNCIIAIKNQRQKMYGTTEAKTCFLNLRPYFKLWANMLMFQEYKFFDSIDSICENMQFIVNFYNAPYSLTKEKDIILLWIKRFASKMHSNIALNKFLEIFNQIPSDPYIVCYTLRGLLTSQQAVRCLIELDMLKILNYFLENPPEEKVLITAIQCVGSFYSHCTSNEIDSIEINIDIIMQYAHDVSNDCVSEVSLKVILKIVKRSTRMTQVFISRDLLEMLSDVFDGGATILQHLAAKIYNAITSKNESSKIITSQPDFIIEKLLPIDALIIQSCKEEDANSIFGALSKIFNDRENRGDYYHVFVENGGKEAVENLSESSNEYSSKAKKFLEFLEYIEDQLER